MRFWMGTTFILLIGLIFRIGVERQPSINVQTQTIDTITDSPIGTYSKKTAESALDNGLENAPDCFIHLDENWWACDNGSGGDGIINPLTKEEGLPPYDYKTTLDRYAINNNGTRALESGNPVYTLYSGTTYTGARLIAWSYYTCNGYQHIINDLGVYGWANITTSTQTNTAVGCNQLTLCSLPGLAGGCYTAPPKQPNLGNVNFNNLTISGKGEN